MTSTPGVPSMASIGPIRNRVPEISRTVTRWSPNGFGRSGEHVANTPASGFPGSPRGCEHVAIGTMQPRDDDDLVPRSDPE